MRRWVGLTLFAVVLLGGAFGVSALAIEWRQQTTDLDPVAAEIADLRADVDEIRALLEPTPTPTPTPTPAPTPTPFPTPEPAAVATMVAGAVVEWQGMRLTVDDVQLHPTGLTPRAFFTLENIDGSPETTSLFTSPRVVDRSGSVCQQGVITSVNRFESLQPGEKFTFQIYWECPNNAVPKTLTLDGAVIFEFAEP